MKNFKNEAKFGFIILHYQTEEDTIKCIESLRKCLQKVEYYIIVVDNASSNGSGKKLRERYQNDSNIYVLLNVNNEGYARGNNVGYKFAKERLKCNYIIFLNSDTEMIQQDFCKIIEKEYRENEYAVMGPLILKSGRETMDNPGRSVPFSVKALRLFIFMNFVLYFLSYMHVDELLEQIFQKYVAVKKKKQKINMLKRQEDVALHGCCLIFTPTFINKEEGLDPRTYMYLEEDLLYEKMHNNGMKMAYLPELRIEHKEAGSTNKVFKNSVVKRRFIYINRIRSGRVLRKYKREIGTK